MSLSDSYKKHGAKEIPYRPAVIIEAVRMVMAHLDRKQQRAVTSLGVAAMLVWMHSETSKTSIDETIEVLREFLATMQADAGRVPKA